MILLMLNQELIKRGNIEKEEKTLEEYQKTQQKVLKNRWEEKKKQYSHVWEERKKLYESYRLGEMTAEEYRNRALMFSYNSRNNHILHKRFFR